MVCGEWWSDSFCRDELEVVKAAERKRRFGVKGSCTVWRNRTTGEETITLPNEKMKRLGDIVKAKEAAGKLEAKRLPHAPLASGPRTRKATAEERASRDEGAGNVAAPRRFESRGVG